MQNSFAAAALTLALLAASAASSGLAMASDSSVVLNDRNVEAVRTTLTQQGYEVGKVKLEDGYYEAYARKDGKKLEVLLDGDFKIVRTETKD